MSDFKDLPEFIELDIGESIAARTETLSSFRELGPPDLCHVVKATGSRNTLKEVGSYHYCSGVEASSSASLAAYLNSLTFAIEDSSAWFGGKSSGWKVRSGTYCCFNAFSRVDLRVEVKIPGGVESYAIDLRGERHEATPELWLETYLSALLRAIRYADDASYRLAGYRKLDPITSVEGEARFLEAAETLFFKGWQLGSDPEIQVATIISNHLTAGIMKYFGDSSRLQFAANLFEKLVDREPEVASLLARAYIGMNEEVKAIQILNSALLQSPQSYPLLHAQADFLRSKGRNDWALKLARQAVNCAPSEFVTWAKLTEVYVEMGMYDSALLTLNSCPMFTFNERDLHRMPTPTRTHLPIKAFIAASNILDEDAARDNEADIALLRLPAPALRGTFAQAYALLARLVSQIGWDDLLKARSSVFVMEEEYRKHKTQASMDGSVGTSLVGNATPRATDFNSPTLETTQEEEADEDASTRGVRSPMPPQPMVDTKLANGNGGGQHEGAETGNDELEVPETPIPTIKISSESDRDKEHLALQKHGVLSKEEDLPSPVPEEDESEAKGKGDGPAKMKTPDLEKPATAQTPKESKEELEGGPSSATTNGDVRGKGKGKGKVELVLENDEEDEESFSFSNKRLCERWLDNLFMVLYEDLRVYTIWRAEISHFKTQHMSYRKTGTEWEILGELAQRLHHKEEAKDAFQRCLDSKFSAKAWLKLLEFYAEEGDLERTLNAAIRLTTYHHRWYMESSYPTLIAHYLFKLGQVHGHAKISYTLQSKSLPPGIYELMQGYLKYGQTFKVEGYEF